MQDTLCSFAPPLPDSGYVVEKDVPLPRASTKYPFGQMAVGDSFRIGPDDCEKVMSAARAWAKKMGNNYVFRRKRAENGQLRVWRVA